jgi:glycosyltransferase involved in cell wall biosynthesis
MGESEGGTVRVVLYTHHAMFEPALSLAESLADRAEVHLLLEVPAGSWQLANFEAESDSAPTGLVDADPVLAPFYPGITRERWRKTSSFKLVAPGQRRARHPESLRLMFRVLRYIRALQPDVLHIDDVDVSPRLALLIALSRAPCPLLVGCHDPDPHSGERRWLLKRITRHLMFARASAYVVHHESGRQALERRHRRVRGRVHAVRLAAYTFLRDLAPELPTPAGSDPVVLLFGRITPYKGVELLFRAAPLVAEEVPNVRFVVAGKPVRGYHPPPPPSLPAGGRIDTSYGYVPSAQTGRLFAQAQVAVCPYTDASQSGVVLTAYAFGCPVVVTDVGGLAEYVEEGTTGLVVAPADHEALAGALVRCLTQPELRHKLRTGVAEATSTSLSWEAASSQLLGIYAGLSSRHPTRRPHRARRRGDS